MSAPDNTVVLFSDTGTDGLPHPGSVPFSVERFVGADGDQIHVVVGDARVVFGSDHFLEIVRKLQWAMVIDRSAIRPTT
jgi:hypothetical protein